MPVIKTGLDSTRRYTFAELNGWLFFANGIDRTQVFDGTITRNMGVKMNGTAPTFVNNTVAGALAASGSYYYIYVYWNSSRNQPSGFSPVSALMTANASGANGIRITIPANASLEPGVDYVKVFRTSDTGAIFYYDGLKAYSGSSITYDSSIADAALGEAAGEVNESGTGNNDVDDLPPTAPYIISHKGRIAMWGGVKYSTGTAAVTNGNSTVTLTGANLTEGMDAWNFLIEGDSKAYIIGSINTGAGTFKLYDALGTEKTYDGTTNGTATYYLYPTGSLFYFSYKDLYGNPRPESYPVTNYLPVQPDDGDEASGIGILGQYWFLGKRKSIYLVAGDSPIEFAARRIDSSVGVCSHWGIANDQNGNIIFPHESGVYITDGSKCVELSKDIRNMFLGTGNYPWKINKQYIDLCHGVYDPIENCYLLWVPSNDYMESGLDSTICDKVLRYDFNDIIVEGSSYKIGWTWDDIPATVSAIIKDQYGNPEVWFGDAWGFVKKFSITATNDGVGSGADTRRGTVTSATVNTLTMATAAFYTTGSGLQGVFVHILSGTGAGQIRRITSNTGTQLTVTPNWGTTPDTTSVFGIGAMHSYRKTKQYDFGTLDEKTIRRARLVFDVVATDYSGYLKLFQDFSTTVKTKQYIRLNDTRGFHEIAFAANRSQHHQYELGIHDVDRPVTFRELEIDVDEIGAAEARKSKNS